MDLLQECEQDIKAAQKFHKCAVGLATDALLTHKNAQVRLLTACCLADVIRVFAPKPPFDHEDPVRIDISRWKSWQPQWQLRL